MESILPERGVVMDSLVVTTNSNSGGEEDGLARRHARGRAMKREEEVEKRSRRGG